MDEQYENMTQIHVMPLGDCVAHEESIACLCSPTFDAENQWDIHEGLAHKVVIVHRRISEEKQ